MKCGPMNEQFSTGILHSDFRIWLDREPNSFTTSVPLTMHYLIGLDKLRYL